MRENPIRHIAFFRGPSRKRIALPVRHIARASSRSDREGRILKNRQSRTKFATSGESRNGMAKGNENIGNAASALIGIDRYRRSRVRVRA